MSEHPKDHILVNTMRASAPQRTSPTEFEIVVQNQVQLLLMEEKRPELLAYIADKLHNDHVNYTVKINEGAGPRYTLSDQELLDSMRAEHPMVQQLIERFHLRLS